MDRHVFVSHSTHDKKIALGVTAALENRGIPCWIASRDVRPGDNFQSAIVDAIATAHAMVLIFSENANNSNEIRNELALASQNRLLVVPVRVENVLPQGAYQYELATRQWVDLFDGWERAITRISDQIGKIPDPPPEPKGWLERFIWFIRRQHLIWFIRRNRRALVAIAATAILLPAIGSVWYGKSVPFPFAQFSEAGPAAAGNDVHEFVIHVTVGNKRRVAKWVRAAPNTWVEIGDDNARSSFKVVRRIVVSSCAGTVVSSLEEKKYAFIPDKQCPGMAFKISYDGVSLGTAAIMEDII